MTNKQKLVRLKTTKAILIILVLALGVNTAMAINEPDAITDLAAVGNNETITLTWTEPNDNGSAITSYTVEYGTVASGLFAQTCTDSTCTDTTAGATVPTLTNHTNYQFRVTAVNGNGNSPVSNTATAVPNPCAPLSNNDDSGGPTISESCLGVQINAGSISLEYSPSSFNFPQQFSSSFPLNSFSNDNSATAPIDVATDSDDIITVKDLRNSGGFDVTITSSNFLSGSDTIDLANLYIATSYPEDSDLTPLDTNLIGTEINEAEFATNSSNTGNMDTTSTVHSDNATGTPTNSTELTTLINAYTTDGKNFDANDDDIADTLTLMSSTAARVARISQALGFYLSIPADQVSGTYSILFTIDLIPN